MILAKNVLLKLNTFLGLNCCNDGENELKSGESPLMKNFLITDGYKLKKRDGFSTVSILEDEIRGIWYGSLKDSPLYVAVAGNNAYISKSGFDTLENGGVINGNGRVFFFEFYSNLYIFSGSGIYEYAENGFSPIDAYRPLIMTQTLPKGTGILFEKINLLSGKMRQSFSSDGESLTYKLAFDNIESVDYVKLDGVLLPDHSYTSDPVSGTVSFLNAPPQLYPDCLEIGFTKDSGTENKILSCKFASSFGGANDTRVFLWGNPNYPAMRFFSELVDGSPSLSYFPETNFTFIGDGEPITHIMRHFDRQLIFTENSAYYSGLQTEENDGLLYASFPVYPLSSQRGNILSSMATLINNMPCTFDRDGIFGWQSTNVRDERNVFCISKRINELLTKEDIKKAYVYNDKDSGELYVCFENKTYVYNYGLDVFYFYDGFTAKCFCRDEKDLYFCNEKRIFRVGGKNDDGKAISSIWQSKYFDFDTKQYTKNLFSVTVGLKPSLNSFANLEWSSDNATQYVKGLAKINVSLKSRLFSFLDMNFKSFSFNTSHTPKLIRRRLKVKRFAFLKLIIKNDLPESDAHILSLSLEGQINDAKI